MGALRHRNILTCPLGAMAQYFFWRWHVGGEAPPHFGSRRAWYMRKLLVPTTTDPERELAYVTQLEHVNTAFNKVGIESTAKTQAMRGCGSRGAELHGISEAQVRI
jgi:hypothetical protein